ncbi:hypothetical protein D4764_0240580 [Takifugu flavidus]|uniref:Ig-like domain-containing protein n=1 Tax=Takifugu flavidus TaxID=433684 RepID=A0A5C6MKD3_9TELE|nr:hypothetical protein D4764_0240580 [Takifugu flavidus]
MFATKLVFAVVGFILNSGVLGKGSSICALKVTGLTKDDKTSYCCNEKPENCHKDHIQLTVTALQVKVFPTTDGQTVTLMCSTACNLTEKRAAYIWYRNSELLYQDWSPWYQEMVTSDKTVRYSCAIKGYEALRAPAVTVESVSSTCFTVSYNDGRICLYNHTSVKGPCSITYPTALQVKVFPTTDGQTVTLMCSTACTLTGRPAAYIWYRNSELLYQDWSPWYQEMVTSDKTAGRQPGEEIKKKLGETVVQQLCSGIRGTGRNITMDNFFTSVPLAEKLLEKDLTIVGTLRQNKADIPPVMKPSKLREIYSSEFGFRGNMTMVSYVPRKGKSVVLLSTMHDDKAVDESNHKKKPDVILFYNQTKGGVLGKGSRICALKDIKVKISPSTEVTEGDRVKLTCSTSCPLTNNKNYIWYLNDQLLQLPEHQNKHLVLDVVTPQHAGGNYSCAMNTQRDVRSPEKTLRVQSSSLKWTLAAAAGVGAALMVFISLVICCIRGKRKLSQNTVLKLEEVNHGPVYEEITDQPTEENGIYYSSIRFPQTDVDPLDSMVQPHQHQQEQHNPYAVVWVLGKDSCICALKVTDLKKDDKTSYCCNEKPENCHEDHIQLTVTALQVKVFPTTDGQTVTLMCSTACTLTGRPAAYIWYRNSELLYQDWSPWYQEMVTSDKTVRYSCAIKGYEALRAPAVTVEWVSSTCFTVSYNGGRMCLYNHTSVKGPCSITYPTEIYVEKTPRADHVKLSCNTSCPPTTTQWYKNGEMHKDPLQLMRNTSQDNFLCAVSGVKELQSEEVCAADKSCLTVNYIKKRICALEGSSVNISSKYSSSKYTKSKAKHWSKIIWNGEKEERMNVLKTDHFTYHEDQEKQINTCQLNL